jgi:hypothetical protein
MILIKFNEKCYVGHVTMFYKIKICFLNLRKIGANVMLAASQILIRLIITRDYQPVYIFRVTHCNKKFQSHCLCTPLCNKIKHIKYFIV